ncbi:MAG: hypothetical protein J0I32_05870 [Sphingobacteriales bacterium]|nr:hypothetical protein [Sphingobacteriales bacterium]OJW03904.1 MAG: hypothetical protein BGO52_17290 [Sphingobacteriales bacterium 44-61]
MPITTEKYDQLKIDKLKHLLTELAAKGQARPFEIFVDGLKVVPKTEDVKEFENYEYYINEDSEKIRILIYYSLTSPRNDQYVYYIQRGRIEKPLSGLGELDGIIQEKLEARDREHEARQIKQELEETKKQLEEAEQYAELLEKQLEQANSNKHKLGKLDLVELGSLVLERMAAKNAGALERMGLGGIVAAPVTEAIAEPVAASFEKQQHAHQPEQRHIELFQQLESVFNNEQLEIVMQIIGKFATEPTHLQTVASLLNIDIKNETT